MKQACFCFMLLILGICCVTANAQDTGVALVQASGVDISEILQAVQKNVESLKEQFTNLIADEEITIEEFDNKGKVKKTTNILSEYRIIPTKSEKHFSYGIPQEERTMLSAKENGKIKKMKIFFDPLLGSVNVWSDLFMLFDKQNENDFDYSLPNSNNINIHAAIPGEENKKIPSGYKISLRKELDNRKFYLISIIQKNADIVRIKNDQWNIKYHGIALIDKETMEVAQLNRQRTEESLTIAFGIVKIRKYYFTQYEYDNLKIGDRLMTLPTVKTIEVYRENGQLDSVYKYKYSNYREFTVDTKIEYGAID